MEENIEDKPLYRQSLPLDWKIIDEMLEAGCLGTEIASRFGVHPNTLYRQVEDKFGCRFSEYSQQKRANGEAILRKTQFDVATKDKDRSMLIWLGKQRLGQRDKEREDQGNVFHIHTQVPEKS